MMRRVLLPLLLLVCFGALAGCGSSQSASSGDPDPAKAAPRRAVFYASAVIRPDGRLGDDVAAAGKKILRGRDLNAEIHRLIDKAGREKDKSFSYAKDVQPWLGKRAGVFITGVRGGHAEGAVVVATTDSDKARTALERSEKRDSGTERKVEYRGETYLKTPGDDSVDAVVGDYLIGGNETGMKAAIDALKGSSLADSKAYADARSKVTKDGLATFYVDAPRLLDVVAQSNPQVAQVIGQLRGIPEFAKLKPTAAAMTVTSDAIAFEAPNGGSQRAADATAALPADSWLAFAAPGAGDQIRRQVELLAGLPGGDMVGVFKRQLRAQVGLDLDRDLLDWIDGVSVYAGGTTLLDLNAGVILTSKDPTASRAAVMRIGRVVKQRAKVPVRSVAGGFELRPPNAPGPVTVAAEGDKVVIAYGKDGVRRALHPSGRLGGSPAYAAAKKAIGGGKPSFLLSVPAILQLVQNFGAADDPQYVKALPYLRVFDSIAAGTGTSGGKTVGRLGVGLK
jgi:hypothetical protein